MPPEDAPPGRRLLGTLLLTAFGLGTVSRMPGTVTSLAVVVCVWLGGGDGRGGLLLCVLFALYGIMVTLRFAGGVTDADGHGDPGWVVSDEVAGQALACLGALPFGCDWLPLAGAFVLFRILDIAKPWPVGALERLPGARGVLMDDVAAGGIAAGVVFGAGALGAFALL